MLEAHAGADVGVDGVGTGNCLHRVMRERDAAAGGLGDFNSLGDDVQLRRIAPGRGNGAVRAELRGRKDERVADVVPVAHINELQAAHGAEFFFEREEIRDGLTGMFVVRECIDDGHARAGGHFRDGVMRVGAQHDDVHPALKIARHVGQ